MFVIWRAQTILKRKKKLKKSNYFLLKCILCNSTKIIMPHSVAQKSATAFFIFNNLCGQTNICTHVPNIQKVLYKCLGNLNRLIKLFIYQVSQVTPDTILHQSKSLHEETKNLTINEIFISLRKPFCAFNSTNFSLHSVDLQMHNTYTPTYTCIHQSRLIFYVFFLKSTLYSM